VHARLESAGYRNIEKIERESGSYEIKAIDRNGQRVKLYVHPQTGEVMNRRYRDARHDTSHDTKRDKYDSGSARNNPRNSADCNERRCRDDLPQPGSVQPAAGK
ncbi:MAG: PepSY domain-containing protein, partial [Candidatus Accumulibacter sp.]|nr:PepSY domain-containing protein [Accumulibacter sp.]